MADSWGVDCHKWLNTPYDCGVALVREAALPPRRDGHSGALPSDQCCAGTFPLWSGIVASGAEMEVWAALRHLGQGGVDALVARTCRHARTFADGLRAAGHEVLNEVVLDNQVLVAFGSDERTREVIRRIQESGVLWCGGSVWQGRARDADQCFLLGDDRSGRGFESADHHRPSAGTLSRSRAARRRLGTVPWIDTFCGAMRPFLFSIPMSFSRSLALFALLAAPLLAQNGRSCRRCAGACRRPRMVIPPAPAPSAAEGAQDFQAPAGVSHRGRGGRSADRRSEFPFSSGPDGRLSGLEMRGFMPDADGDDERAPVGVIAVLEDTDGDGRYDKRTVFMDGLVLPRAMSPLVGDGVLIAEPPHLWFCRDTRWRRPRRPEGKRSRRTMATSTTPSTTPTA
jgi:hypothetical protein